MKVFCFTFLFYIFFQWKFLTFESRNEFWIGSTMCHFSLFVYLLDVYFDLCVKVTQMKQKGMVLVHIVSRLHHISSWHQSWFLSVIYHSVWIPFLSLSLQTVKAKRPPLWRLTCYVPETWSVTLTSSQWQRSSVRSGSGSSGVRTMSSRRTEPRMKGTVHRANGCRKKLYSHRNTISKSIWNQNYWIIFCIL